MVQHEVFNFLAGDTSNTPSARPSAAALRNLGGGMPMSTPTGQHVLPTPLRDDIQKFKLAGFAGCLFAFVHATARLSDMVERDGVSENHFRTVKRRQGFSKVAIPMQDVIRWQPEPLDKSLLASTKQLNRFLPLRILPVSVL